MRREFNQNLGNPWDPLRIKPCIIVHYMRSSCELHAIVSLCLQDKAIAFKIFELGLKKFADEPAYVLAYLDHLSHLNGQDE